MEKNGQQNKVDLRLAPVREGGGFVVVDARASKQQCPGVETWPLSHQTSATDPDFPETLVY